MSDRDYPWLERGTSLVLLLVLLAVAGMVLASVRPQWCAWVALEVQVWIVVGLLVMGLVLVSLVALLHTRS
jgi:hypothetical protein